MFTQLKNKKNIIACIILLVFIMLLFIFIFKKENSEYSKYLGSKEAFGTIFTISLYSDNIEKFNETTLKDFCDKIFNEADRLEKIFSVTIPDSELSLLNESAYNTEIKVSDELFTVLEKSLYYCELSEGAFDISIGNLISLWDIGNGKNIIPETSQIDTLKNASNWKNIVLNKDRKTVQFTSEDVKINLGAIAKGYAGDVLKNMLTDEFNISHAILNLGGNIVTIGSKPDGSDWNIGIKNPLDVNSILTSLSIEDKAIVTSGNYERYFELNGIRYHHILDPFTGFPSDNGIISSTIIGTSSTDCDALSTTCYIIGIEKSLKLINSIDGYEAIFVDNSGNTYKTEGLMP